MCKAFGAKTYTLIFGPATSFFPILWMFYIDNSARYLRMNWFSRLFRRIFKVQPRNFQGDTSEELIAGLERLVKKLCLDFQPEMDNAEARYFQAEQCAFTYFWLEFWHAGQQPRISSYRTLLEVLKGTAQDASIAVKMHHSLNHAKGWDPDDFFRDRVRIYSSVMERDPWKSTGGPPPIVSTAYHLGLYAAKKKNLDIRESINGSGDALSLCLSERMLSDALEMFRFSSHVKATLDSQMLLAFQVMEELHLRRLEKEAK